MRKGTDPQDRIFALEQRIRKQREAAATMDAEIKRLRAFVRAVGFDPDDLRYSDRKPPKLPSPERAEDLARECNRRRDALASVIKFLELGLSITALTNAKDYLASMDGIDT